MPVGVCYLHSKMITFGVVCAVVNNLFTVQGIIACIVFLSTVLFLLLLYLRDGYVPDLQKKAVLITGCDTGFGHMLAKRLDAMGLCVFACCLTSYGETKLKGECSTKLRTLRLNVAEAGDVKEALEFVKTRLPPNQGLWAVVNNAGIGYPAPIEWQTLEEMKKVVDVNLWGTVAITKTFLPLLKKARGRIVNVASSAGRLANPGASAYCISKFGVEAFSDSLRNEVRHFGVTVHIIEPGVFKTNITDTERHVQHLDRLWENLDAETKESYGIEFLEKGKKMLVHYHWLRSPRTDKVVNAMAHAVTSGYPKLRYIVGWDHKLFWRTLSFLPSEVQDLVFISFPKPTGTCSKEKYS